LSDVLYEKVISENEDKNSQLRLVVNEFRDVQYLHLRKYYQDYEGNWMPTKEGASMPYTIAGAYALLDGLIEIVATEESVDSINTHFAERLQSIKPSIYREYIKQKVLEDMQPLYDVFK
jgi:hypothetical protein